MFKRYIQSAFVISLCTGLCFFNCITTGREKDNVNTRDSGKSLTLCELVNSSSQDMKLPDEITVEAIVKQIFICPPCPENADCEYCPPDFILFEDGGCTFKIDPPEKQFFIEGKRYRLTLRKSRLNLDRDDFLSYYIADAVQK